jgi:hypothetical protein
MKERVMFQRLSPADRREAVKCMIYLAALVGGLLIGLVGGFAFGWKPFL